MHINPNDQENSGKNYICSVITLRSAASQKIIVAGEHLKTNDFSVLV